MYISTASSVRYLRPLWDCYRNLVGRGRPPSLDTFNEAVRVIGARFASDQARMTMANLCIENRFESMRRLNRPTTKKESA